MLAQLAERSGIPRAYLAKYERGLIYPPSARLACIARSLRAERQSLLDPVAVGSGLASLLVTADLTHQQLISRLTRPMTLARCKSLKLGVVGWLPDADAAALASA